MDTMDLDFDVVELNNYVYIVTTNGEKWSIKYSSIDIMSIHNNKLVIDYDNSGNCVIALRSGNDCVILRNKLINLIDKHKELKKKLTEYTIHNNMIVVDSKYIQFINIEEITTEINNIKIKYLNSSTDIIANFITITMSNSGQATSLAVDIQNRVDDSKPKSPRYTCCNDNIKIDDINIQFFDIDEIYSENDFVVIRYLDRFDHKTQTLHQINSNVAARLVSFIDCKIKDWKNTIAIQYRMLEDAIRIGNKKWTQIMFSTIVSIDNNKDIVQIKYNRKEKVSCIYIKEVCEMEAKILVETIKSKMQDTILPDEFELHADYVWVLKNKIDIDYDIKYDCISNIVLLNKEIAITWIHNNLTEFTSIIHRTRESAQRTVDLLIYAMKIDQVDKKKKLTEYDIYDDLIAVVGTELPWVGMSKVENKDNVIQLTHKAYGTYFIVMSNTKQAEVLSKDINCRITEWCTPIKKYVVSVRNNLGHYIMVGCLSKNKSDVVHDIVNKKATLLNIQEVKEFPELIDVTIDLVNRD